MCSSDLGDLDETIYMHQAEGYHKGGSNRVYRLLKSLYGLKQAARQWNKKLHNTLIAMGFKRLESDHAIYIFVRDDVRIIIPVFIDDITFASLKAASLRSWETAEDAVVATADGGAAAADEA